MENCSYVASIVDLAAKQHSPIFTSPTVEVMWRNTFELLKERKASFEEVVLFVHGEFDEQSFVSPFQPYLEPLIFSCLDKKLLRAEDIEPLVGKFAGGDLPFEAARQAVRKLRPAAGVNVE